MPEITDPAPAGKRVTLSDAQQWIDAYAAIASDTDLRSLTVSASYLQAIINQPDCQYIRFFLAQIDPQAQPQGFAAGYSLVAIGVDSANSNIKKGDDDTEVYETFDHCPPNCNIGDSSTTL